jgi:hypothetical protein
MVVQWPSLGMSDCVFPCLQLWLYREGFARFCNVKYKFSLKDKDLDNSFMHLTNVAIQVGGSLACALLVLIVFFVGNRQLYCCH